MEEMLEKWVEDPIANLNLLNQLIPSVIEAFQGGSDNRSIIKKVIAIVESIRDILEEKEILTGELYRAILSQSELQT